jgi:hypothetical protein
VFLLVISGYSMRPESGGDGLGLRTMDFQN